MYIYIRFRVLNVSRMREDACTHVWPSEKTRHACYTWVLEALRTQQPRYTREHRTTRALYLIVDSSYNRLNLSFPSPYNIESTTSRHKNIFRTKSSVNKLKLNFELHFWIDSPLSAMHAELRRSTYFSTVISLLHDYFFDSRTFTNANRNEKGFLANCTNSRKPSVDTLQSAHRPRHTCVWDVLRGF